MSFLFGALDDKDKKDYDSSLKFPNQNVTVSKSEDADAGADMYDLNFGVEIPVYDVTEYLKNLRELSMEIFNIFEQITSATPVTNDNLKRIISILKKLLFVIQNIYDVFNAYTYSDSKIEVYMTVTVLTALQSQLEQIRKYISQNESKISPNTNYTTSNAIKTDVTKIIQLTYAAAGAVAVASSDDANIATETNVKTIYDAVNKLDLTSKKEAGNFIDGVRIIVLKQITSITDNELLYAAISKKSEYLDFYCNNKINVKLLFDTNKIKVGKSGSGPGVPDNTSCLLTQYKMEGADDSDDSGQSDADADASSAKTNYEALITTLTHASEVVGLDPADKTIVDEIIKKANAVTEAKNATEYNTKIGELQTEIAKIQSDFKTDPVAAAANPPSITINGTVCSSTDDVKTAFDKIVGIDAAKLATMPPTPSTLENLATLYYKVNIRQNNTKDTSTPGIRISTQAKIQSAIVDLKSTITTPTAKDYDDKFKADKVFVDMSKDNSELVSTLSGTKSEKNTLKFEFDLSEFVFDLASGNVSSGSSPKNLLLLHKGSWISIVFKNVYIPLKQTFGFLEKGSDPLTDKDGIIQPDALMLMLSINNTAFPNPKSAGVVAAAQPDMNPFKDFFFMKTNHIIFGTKNQSALTFQTVKVTGEKLVDTSASASKTGIFKGVAQKFQAHQQGKQEAADLATRKQSFLTKTNSIVDGFRTNCIDKTAGKVDAEKSNEYIRNLYNSNIDEEQLKNIFGLTGKMPRLIFALTQSLIPGDNNVENSMLLIVRALAGDDNIKPWNEQSKTQPIPVPVKTVQGVQGGGGGEITDANIEKATGIIKDMMKALTEKQFMAQNVSSTFISGLDNAEQKIKLNKEDPDSIEISVPVPVSPPSAVSTPVHAPASPLASAAAKGKDMLSNIFGSKSSSSSSSSSSSDRTNMETCGNTANVTCNGENLIVTVTLKTSDLLNQCGITHESILNMANQSHEQQQNSPNLYNAPQSDHAKKVINYIKALSDTDAKKYIQTLTPDQLSLIQDTHTTDLNSDLKQALDTAKNKSSDAGAGSFTDKQNNNLSVSPITNLEVGQTQQLTILGGGTGKKITYKSLNESIATVDTTGLVTGVAQGKAKIQITQAESDTMKGTEFDIEVTVVAVSSAPTKPPAPTPTPTPALKVNTLSFTTVPSVPIQLDIAKSSTTTTYNLGTTNVPKSDVNNTTPFTYESSDTAVASVDASSGLVTGVAEGDCEINITQAATSEFDVGKLTANIKVVDSSSKTPLPAKTSDETKYNTLKAKYDAIEKTKADLKSKIAEITNKIKNITMTPEEIVNETKYKELKNRYDAMVIKQNEIKTKVTNLVSSITSSGLFGATEV
jgi:hypothetical protein